MENVTAANVGTDQYGSMGNVIAVQNVTASAHGTERDWPTLYAAKQDHDFLGVRILKWSAAITYFFILLVFLHICVKWLLLWLDARRKRKQQAAIASGSDIDCSGDDLSPAPREKGPKSAVAPQPPSPCSTGGAVTSADEAPDEQLLPRRPRSAPRESAAPSGVSGCQEVCCAGELEAMRRRAEAAEEALAAARAEAAALRQQANSSGAEGVKGDFWEAEPRCQPRSRSGQIEAEPEPPPAEPRLLPDDGETGRGAGPATASHDAHQRAGAAGPREAPFAQTLGGAGRPVPSSKVMARAGSAIEVTEGAESEAGALEGVRFSLHQAPLPSRRLAPLANAPGFIDPQESSRSAESTCLQAPNAVPSLDEEMDGGDASTAGASGRAPPGEGRAAEAA